MMAPKKVLRRSKRISIENHQQNGNSSKRHNQQHKGDKSNRNRIIAKLKKKNNFSPNFIKCLKELENLGNISFKISNESHSNSSSDEEVEQNETETYEISDSETSLSSENESTATSDSDATLLFPTPPVQEIVSDENSEEESDSETENNSQESDTSIESYQKNKNGSKRNRIEESEESSEPESNDVSPKYFTRSKKSQALNTPNDSQQSQDSISQSIGSEQIIDVSQSSPSSSSCHTDNMSFGQIVNLALSHLSEAERNQKELEIVKILKDNFGLYICEELNQLPPALTELKKQQILKIIMTHESSKK